MLGVTTLRAIGHFAGVVVLAVALAGCGDDGDSAATDDAGSVAGEADVSEDAADQDGGDDAAAGEADSDSTSDSASDDAGDGSGDSDGDGADGDSDSGDGDAAPGVFRDYSADAVADTSYDTTVLFFWASWCPDCRAYEQVILDEGLPDGVQILKIDYDTEQELRDRYGINHQSWFVKVDSDGDELSDWFAYGGDKSVDTILEQLG